MDDILLPISNSSQQKRRSQALLVLPTAWHQKLPRLKHLIFYNNVSHFAGEGKPTSHKIWQYDSQFLA